MSYIIFNTSHCTTDYIVKPGYYVVLQTIVSKVLLTIVKFITFSTGAEVTNMAEDVTIWTGMGQGLYCTLHTVHNTLHSLQCTVYSVQNTLYSVHYTLHTVQYTLFTKQDITLSVRPAVSPVVPSQKSWL